MEEVLPPHTASGAGFEPMGVRQFTVFLENRVGRLQTLVSALENKVHILSLSIEESADSALVRLICDKPDLGRQTVHDAGFSFTESTLLAVSLPANFSTPITRICTALLAAEINIHYAYPLMAPPSGAALALYVEDPTLAARLLMKKGFALLSESDFLRADDADEEAV